MIIQFSVSYVPHVGERAALHKSDKFEWKWSHQIFVESTMNGISEELKQEEVSVRKGQGYLLIQIPV